MPAISVITSWPILPITFSGNDRKRLPSSIYKVRPTYSPAAVGINMENDNPENTALQAVISDMC